MTFSVYDVLTYMPYKFILNQHERYRNDDFEYIYTRTNKPMVRKIKNYDSKIHNNIGLEEFIKQEIVQEVNALYAPPAASITPTTEDIKDNDPARITEPKNIYSYEYIVSCKQLYYSYICNADCGYITYVNTMELMKIYHNIYDKIVYINDKLITDPLLANSQKINDEKALYKKELKILMKKIEDGLLKCISQDYKQGFLRLYELYYLEEDYDKAMEIAKLCIENNYMKGYFYTKLGRHCISNNEYHKAILYLNLSIEEGYYSSYFELCICYKSINNFDLLKKSVYYGIEYNIKKVIEYKS